MSRPREARLRRRLSLPLLTLYGLGTTIGAGIYVLIGEVAGRAGLFAPVSFLLASLLAAFTAVSFAELSARYPRSAGEALYVYHGFHIRPLATAIGLMVALAGMVAAATIVNGFVGYLGALAELPGGVVIVSLVLILGSLVAWGIGQSVAVAGLVTLVEVAGLLVVVWAASDALADPFARLPELLPSLEGGAWLGILSGAVLAFYAYIGFEDMVNVAEEVKDVGRNLPHAIVLTLAVTTALYTMVAVVAVLAVPGRELAESEAPLAHLYQATTGRSPVPIVLIGLLAVINGALIQMIMASRVLYGLGALGWLPTVLARIHPWTRTPLVATALVTALVTVLALWLPLVALAEITSLTTMLVFATVNLALWRIKRSVPHPPSVRVCPSWVPPVGFLVSGSFVAAQLLRVVAVP